MNNFTGSGRLVRNAVANKDRKGLKFTIAAQFGYDAGARARLVEYVPCVMFNPGENISKLLQTEGKGMLIEFQGHIQTSKFEIEGVLQYRTEAVVTNKTFSILKSKD